MAKDSKFRGQKPDGRSGPYALLPHAVLDSLAYRHLSLRAKALLLQIHRSFNGFNNGKIALSARQIAEGMNSKKYGANAVAMAELIEHGFVAIETEHAKSSRLAREYRLTYIESGTDARVMAATNEYLHWRPSPVSKGKFGVDRGVNRYAPDREPRGQQEGNIALTTGSMPDDEKPQFSVQGPVDPRVNTYSTPWGRDPISSIKGGKTSSARNTAAPDAEDVRQRVKTYLACAGVGAQTRLAKDAAIPGGTLSKFLRGDLQLKPEARISLAAARQSRSTSWAALWLGRNLFGVSQRSHADEAAFPLSA